MVDVLLLHTLTASSTAPRGSPSGWSRTRTGRCYGRYDTTVTTYIIQILINYYDMNDV